MHIICPAMLGISIQGWTKIMQWMDSTSRPTPTNRPAPMIRIYWSVVDHPLPPTEWQRLLILLPDSLHDNILRLKRWQDRHTALLGKLLVRHGLREMGEAEYTLHNWHIRCHGKPAVQSSIYFNISHTHGLVVCALTRQGEIGIDLEQIRPMELTDFQNMVDPVSWQTIMTADNRDLAFFIYWTQRESIVKADSRGLSIPFQALLIDQNQATLTHEFAPPPSQRWHIHPIPLLRGYCCHLAAPWRETDFSIDLIEPQTIY
ncbi:MAG: 4'-phosphopantetheinyl transferase superfamily protein [Magnetococcus sp. YQC-5]